MAVRDGNNTVIGVIGLDVFLDEFTRDVLSAKLGLGGKAFVINGERRAIVAPWLNYSVISETGIFPSMDGRGDEALDRAIQDMIDQKEDYLPVKMDNESFYLSFAPIEGLRLSLGILLPVEEVTGPVEKLKKDVNQTLDESDREAAQKVNMMTAKLIGVMLILIIAVFAVSFFMSKNITGPIVTLMEGADIVGKGDLEHKVRVKTGDELEELARSFNDMASYLNTQMVIVEHTARAKERIERELQIAKDIQQGFLPVKAPEVEGYTMAGVNLPAKEVGGDFYDYIEFEDGKIGLVIADVAGKGVPAALFVGITKTLLRVKVKRLLDPVEALNEVNTTLLEESDSGMFVTLFFAILDPKKHTLTYVNAGHNPPFLLDKGEKEVTLLEAKGVPISVMEGITLEAKEIPLKENATVFFYTDGVSEAVNGKDEEFGTDRILETLMREESASADSLLEVIAQEITDFAGSREQFDDITMMVLQSHVRSPQDVQPEGE